MGAGGREGGRREEGGVTEGECEEERENYLYTRSDSVHIQKLGRGQMDTNIVN